MTISYAARIVPSDRPAGDHLVSERDLFGYFELEGQRAVAPRSGRLSTPDIPSHEQDGGHSDSRERCIVNSTED